MKDHVESKYGQRSLGPEFRFRNPRRHSASRGSTTGSTWTSSGGMRAESSTTNRPSMDSSGIGREKGDGGEAGTPATKSKSNLMANFKVVIANR